MNLAVTEVAILEIARGLKARGVITNVRRINPADQESDKPPEGFGIDTQIPYWMILPAEVFIRCNWVIMIEDESADVVVLVRHTGKTLDHPEGWQTQSNSLATKPAHHKYTLDDPKCFEKVIGFTAELRPSDPSCSMLSMALDFERMKADMEAAKAAGKEFKTENDQPYLVCVGGVRVEHVLGEPERLICTDKDSNKLEGEVGVDYTTLMLLLKKDPEGTVKKYRALFRDEDGVPLKGNQVKEEEATK